MSIPEVLMILMVTPIVIGAWVAVAWFVWSAYESILRQWKALHGGW